MKQETNEVSPTVSSDFCLERDPRPQAKRGGKSGILTLSQDLLINCNCVTLIQAVNYRRNSVFIRTLCVLCSFFSVNLKLFCIVCGGKVSGALGVPLGTQVKLFERRALARVLYLSLSPMSAKVRLAAQHWFCSRHNALDVL